MANDLTPTPATAPCKPSSAKCTRPNLTAPKPWYRMNREQTKTLLSKYRQALKPAGGKMVMAEMARLSPHFWQPNRPPGELQSVMRDYVVELQRFPPDLIAGACWEWRRIGKWFPKLSELLEIIEPEHAERVRDMKTLEERLKPRVAPTTDAEAIDPDAAREILAETLVALRGNHENKPGKPMPRYVILTEEQRTAERELVFEKWGRR